MDEELLEFIKETSTNLHKKSKTTLQYNIFKVEKVVERRNKYVN